MKVLSLFDGMACGMIAMQLAGMEVESYDAYEIDKYAIKTAQHNFPMIKEHGDVFGAEFTQYEGVDFLIGGSPCTYWSIAQTKNRETVASGMGWELFSQYVRALHEAKPKYFIYENNKSMSNAIRASIDETFGFEAVLINSALVSAQNRQRLYWVGKRNPDGTYSKVDVEQPDDRGILLRDILETGVCWREKSCTLDANYYKDGIRNMVGNTVDGKTCVAEPIRIGTIENDAKNPNHDSQQYRVYSPDGKGVTLCGNGGGLGAKTGLYAVPCDCDVVITENSIRCQRRDKKHSTVQGSHVNFTDVKSQTLSPTHIPNVIEPKSCGDLYAIPTMPVKEATARGYTEIECGECVDLSMPNSKTRRGRNMKDKSNCMQTSNEFYQYVGYAIEFDNEGNLIKAIGKVGKEITIYEVKDGKITIKGKQYPIKLRDGQYIIRKLTVRECMRLQTVPEWYEFPVSDSQAYKMLRNGWTCEVIAHILKYSKDA